MSVTTERSAATQNSAVAPTVQRRRAPWLAVLVGALAVVTVGLVVAWNLPRPVVQSASGTDLSAYAAGGSVYAQQVPAVRQPWTVAYAPGSTAYREQVPSLATDWTTAFAPGSTTYRQQVPQG